MATITSLAFQVPAGWALSDLTWLWSDTHWGNQSLLVDIGMRPADHHERMMRAWEDQIFPLDSVLHMGDFEFYKGDPEFRRAGYAEIKARTALGIVVAGRGNHDPRTPTWYQREFGWAYVLPGKEDQWVIRFTEPRSGKIVAISHSPLLTTAFDWDVNIHGHIHTNGYGLRCKDFVEQHGKRYICVCVEYTNYQPINLGRILTTIIPVPHAKIEPWIGDYQRVGLATHPKALGVGLPDPPEVHQVFDVPFVHPALVPDAEV